jgi:hypothetical protein
VNYWLDLRDVGAPTGEQLDDALDEAARSVVPSSAGWSSVTPEGEGWEVRRAVEPSMESWPDDDLDEAPDSNSLPCCCNGDHPS